MKSLFYWMLLVPLLVISQENQEYGVLENAMLTAAPAKIQQFESGIAAHNKKFHASGPYGARVYWISNGPNVGKYIWVMGPLTWSAFDSRPAAENGHDADWNMNVLPYILPESDQTYWKFESGLSNFSQGFTIKNLLVDMYDIKRFQKEKVMKMMEKIKKVMVEKFPEETYGMYTNILPSTKDGRDLAYVSFFEKSAWMGEDGKFPEKYNEVHGAGSFESFLKEWGEVSQGQQSELWIFRPDLSGLSGEVKAGN
ncbi:hypothetical protein L1I30_12730 [Gillisia sp. M10.2A]|uniref:Uncharacterized protein n=1 Tax=Gillisia lutea TaxID=2909668 RepID=A0ABS9EI52_9FLAO|nr:hypothetical protein [Gillisia lutea]MCF4102533.1 hypothetical protein [Gillisia lutea]